LVARAHREVFARHPSLSSLLSSHTSSFRPFPLAFRAKF
jgi:hypothetical protein